MADPVWTAQYNYSQTPETNGFSRTLYKTPVVTVVTSGPVANRRVEINSASGDVVFITSNVPSLDPSIGATAEAVVSVTGPGDAGFELTFLTRALMLQVYATGVGLTVCDDIGGEKHYRVKTAPNNVDTKFRMTLDGSNNVHVYREGSGVIGPVSAEQCEKPFQRVLWWGESSGTQTFKAMKYYIGGAVAP